MSTQLRILMTADCVGGVWTYALELCRALAPHNVQVTLYVMGGPLRADQIEEAGALTNLSLVPSNHKLEWMRNPQDDLARSAEELLALESRMRPDIVHINGYWHATLPFCAPVLSVAHSCVTSWWLACHGCRPPEEWSDYENGVAAGISAADMVVAPSAAYLESLCSLHDGPSSARVVHNGCDLAAPNPEKVTTVLAAGRIWDRAKNIAMLDRALEGTGVPLVVAGELRSPDGSHAEATSATMLGAISRSELHAHMASAAIFASPALYEPFGLSVLEAALNGCALVLSDIPTFRELWSGAAIFLPAIEPRSWRHVLARLVRDPARSAMLGQLARARAAHYSAKHMANAYLDIYRELGNVRTGAAA